MVLRKRAIAMKTWQEMSEDQRRRKIGKHGRLAGVFMQRASIKEELWEEGGNEEKRIGIGEFWTL